MLNNKILAYTSCGNWAAHFQLLVFFKWAAEATEKALPVPFVRQVCEAMTLHPTAHPALILVEALVSEL